MAAGATPSNNRRRTNSMEAGLARSCNHNQVLRVLKTRLSKMSIKTILVDRKCLDHWQPEVDHQPLSSTSKEEDAQFLSAM
jgi:hypothetical protein